MTRRELRRQHGVLDSHEGLFVADGDDDEGVSYHIRAESLEDAIAYAKRNPEFAYSSTARIEVRPLKVSEPETGFDYPTTL